jgi:HPt (histidine-containing phosphotransfer) domain-containing protein
MSNLNDINIDLSYLKEVSDGNTEFIIEMIDIFLMQTPSQVVLLSEAINNEDWEKIAAVSHKMKPTFAFVGVESAKDAMAEIELAARKKEDFNGIVSKYDEMKNVFETIFSKLEVIKKELQETV